MRRLVNGRNMPDVEHSFMSMHIHVYSNIPCKTSCYLPQICQASVVVGKISSVACLCGMPQTQILESPSDGQHLQTKGDITMS